MSGFNKRIIPDLLEQEKNYPPIPPNSQLNLGSRHPAAQVNKRNYAARAALFNPVEQEQVQVGQFTFTPAAGSGPAGPMSNDRAEFLGQAAAAGKVGGRRIQKIKTKVRVYKMNMRKASTRKNTRKDRKERKERKAERKSRKTNMRKSSRKAERKSRKAERKH
jgi:hypothetical protein